MNSITVELDQAEQEGAYDSRAGAFSRRIDRISQTIERGILVFVVLATLLGNYVAHSYLMRDILIS
jgi:hypothetical protein